MSGAGGKYFFDDDQETPDTQTAVYHFDDMTLTYEMRLWSNYSESGLDQGVVFYGDQGLLRMHRAGAWEVVWTGNKPGPRGEHRNDRGKQHRVDFLECVRTRKSPAADIAVGYRSSVFCHLGNVATRLQRTIPFDGKTLTFVGDAEANRLIGREYRKGFEVV